MWACAFIGVMMCGAPPYSAKHGLVIMLVSLPHGCRPSCGAQTGCAQVLRVFWCGPAGVCLSAA
eukprot:scaffold143436_cov37-Tisochrysis_lutea.AAC.1